MSDKKALRSPWRVTFFAVVTAGLAALGYLLHMEARSTHGLPETHEAPMSIGVYVSDAEAPVDVSLEVDHRLQKSGHIDARLSVYVPQPAKVLLTSTLPINNRAVSRSTWKRGNHFDSDAKYYTVLDTTQLNDTGNYYDEGTFSLSADSLSRDSYSYGEADSIYVNAPDVAPNETLLLPESQYGTTATPKGQVPQLFEGTYRIGDDPSKDAGPYSGAPGTPILGAIPGRKFTDLFYQPRRLLTTELADDVGSSSSFDIENVSPTDYKEANGDYTWTASGGLHATLAALRSGLREQDSNLDFLSGIAFATAAAGLIALVQEMPDTLLWWRREKKEAPSPPPKRLS